MLKEIIGKEMKGCFSNTLGWDGKGRDGKLSMSTELCLIQHQEERQFQQKYSNKMKQNGPPPLARGAPEIFSTFSPFHTRHN
jgi:hypothetical protein